MSNRPATALAVEGLSYGYVRHQRALDEVTLTVPEASFTALLGPNGAGKTTLMCLITRLFEAREGRIAICGFDLKRQSRAALASMGVVFQQPTLDLDLGIEHNLRYVAGLYGLGRRQARERIGLELERFGLAGRRRDAVRKLSGGLRRRVEIARALLHRPRLLVLDEPTVGLDIASRHAIVEHVHRLCREDGIAVLWTTHLIDEIRAEDRVAVLHEGRVRAAGPVEEVLRATGKSALGGAFRALTGAEAA